MKKRNLLGLLNARSLFLAGVFGLGILVTSCSQVDDVLLTEPSTESAELKAAKAVKKGDLSIAEIALANENFEELVSALVYVDAELDAGLVDLFLNGTDQYTVFAPTDAAFEQLYQALDVEGITELDAQLVLNVLLYHVTEGRRAANSVVPPKHPRIITTLLHGATFSVDATGKIWAVGNTAMIVGPNNSASNGIIHIIDTVLLPITL